MTLSIDERALRAELAPLFEGETCRAGLRSLVSDRFFLAFFLVSVSQGEGLGEAAVGMIGQGELAARIRGLAKQECEERGHKQRTLDLAQGLFPEWFDAGRYRYTHALQGKEYYLDVLEENRAWLKAQGRYTRLNLYLTTTFAYEIMVLLLYRIVADSLRSSPLPAALRARVAEVIESILDEEQEHVGVVGQVESLLETPRRNLSHSARGQLDALAKLTSDDFRRPAERAVRHVVGMTERYADPERYRAEIERRAAPGS